MSSSAVLTPELHPARGEDFEYRALSGGAIASIALGVLSLSIFIAGRNSLESALVLTFLPLVGMAIGLRSLGRIRANPDHYTGRKAAIGGIALSAFCLLGGLAFAGYVFATEVPPGYARRTFADLRPDDADLRADKAIPDEVASLEGKKIFIKGYIRPDSTPYRENIGAFLLVRDNNQCCFGDLSSVKYYDQVAVTMTGKKRVDYHSGLFRMGGTLRVFPENARDLSAGPAYLLEADHAE
jgi:hypothetical protein